MTRDRYFSLLLRMLPRATRDRHGDEMVETFLDMKRERRGRPVAIAGLYLVATWDVMTRASRGWLRRRRGSGTGSRRGFGGVGYDVGFAVRMFRRSPGFSVVAVSTIGLGIGANTAIFTIVDAVILRPLPYESPERLFMVFNQYPTLDVERGAQSPGDLWDYREQTDVMEAFGSVSIYPQTLLSGDSPELVPVAVVTPGFFALLGVAPILGRDITIEDDHDRVVLSYGYWQSAYGGDSAIVGRTLRFDRDTKTVIGVLPADFRLVLPSHLGIPARPRMYSNIPQQGWLGQDGRDRTAHWMNVVARLRDGQTIGAAQAQFDGVAAWQHDNVAKRDERDARIVVVPLHAEVVGGAKRTLMALSVAVGFVLLIACANVANLLLARAQQREREMAIRAAIGGSRGRLVRQVLTEGLVLGAVGGLAGLALAYLGVEAILGLQPDNVPRLEGVQVSGSVLGFAIAISAGSAVLFGLAPAIRASRPGLTHALTVRTGGAGPRRTTLTNALIVGEVSLSLVLLVGSGLLLRSFVELQNVDPGYQVNRILAFKAHPPSNIWGERAANPGEPGPGLDRYYRELEAAIAALPGVEAVGSIFPTPLGGETSGSTYSIRADGEDMEGQIASSQLVTADYFAAVGIPLLAGRAFGPGDGGDKVIIDRALADRMWPGQQPVGRQLNVGWWSGPQWAEVIGVVGNVRTHDLTEPNPPTLYRLGSVYAYSGLTFTVRTKGTPLSVREDIRAVLDATYPTVPMTDVRVLSELAQVQMGPTRFVMTLIGAFAAIALLLASIGLYGVISYLVSQRTREIGIRMAFGASAAQVFGLVLRQGLLLTALGIVTGLAGALALSHLLEGFLFGVTPTDPLTYAALTSLLVAVAVAACMWPARRATRVDPVVSLSSD